MNSNANPSINPADNESLAGSIRFAFNKMMQSTNGMLPARVVSYDRTTNRVQAQLLIAIITTNGTQVSRPNIASIPVLLLGGGTFMISAPLKAGDLGWVIANDRDISLFLQNYQESAPNTYRVKNFSDGLFIPDVMTGYTINPEDENNLVIQKLDGSIRISIWDDKVKIISPETIIEGNLIVNGLVQGNAGITVTGGTGFNVTGNMNLTGNIAVTGNITATGTITPGV